MARAPPKLVVIPVSTEIIPHCGMSACKATIHSPGAWPWGCTATVCRSCSGASFSDSIGRFTRILPTRIMFDGTGLVSGSRRTVPTLKQDVPDVEDREQRGEFGALEVQVGLEALQPRRVSEFVACVFGEPGSRAHLAAAALLRSM